jgi:hypothetical protein
MSPENTKVLYETFPEIYRGKDKPMQQTCMCWGFECGNGWFDILYLLSLLITRRVKSDIEHKELVIKYKEKYPEDNHWKNMEIPPEPVYPEVMQVKEKFGGLRFYMDGSNDYFDGLIAFAESLSYKTCEVCGKPGESNNEGWIKTLCEEHAAERRSKQTSKRGG